MRAKFLESTSLSDKKTEHQEGTTTNGFGHCEKRDALILLRGKLLIDYDWEAVEREELSADQQRDKEF